MCELKDCVEIKDNYRCPVNSSDRKKRKKLAQGLYPYYGATGQVDVINEYMIEGEFVLLGEDGAPFLDRTAPKAYKVSGKIWVNNHAHILMPLISIDFLCYLLNSIDYKNYVKGSTRLKLTQNDMKKILIGFPPLDEQKRIVLAVNNIFSRLDTISESL